MAADGLGSRLSTLRDSEVSSAETGTLMPKRSTTGPLGSRPSRRSILREDSPGGASIMNTASSSRSSVSADRLPLSGVLTTKSRIPIPGSGSIRSINKSSAFQVMVDSWAGHSRPVASVMAPSSRSNADAPALCRSPDGARVMIDFPSRVASRLMFLRAIEVGSSRVLTERRVFTSTSESKGVPGSAFFLPFSRPRRSSAWRPSISMPSRRPWYNSRI